MGEMKLKVEYFTVTDTKQKRWAKREKRKEYFTVTRHKRDKTGKKRTKK